jgi:hypothetical protein
MIMRMVVSRDDLELNVDSEPQGEGPVFFTFLKVSIHEQKNLPTDLTGDETQNPLIAFPVLYPEITG